ncbi:MAG: T9SS type A sorting domain-containing protein [Crocinitomicaceae bacterium]|nr:T9SS type A sorting domain-containing protein [Crocinitomicaceae bacterium]
MKKQYSTIKRKSTFLPNTAIAILFVLSAFNFSFGQCISADTPVISPTNANSYCEGDTMTITWTGNLNDNLFWYVYNGNTGQEDTVYVNSLQIVVGTSTNIEINGSDGCADGGYNDVDLYANPTYDINTLERICSGDSVLIWGNYESTAGFYPNVLSSISGCDSTVTVELIIKPLLDDQTITPIQSAFCDSGTVLINMANSELGVQYYLRDNSTNDTIDGPFTGTGAGLAFDPGMVYATTDYSVYAVKQALGASFDISSAYLDGGSPVTSKQNDVTMECWFKWDGNTSTSKTLMVNGHEGNGGYSLRLNTDSTIYILFGGVGYVYSNQAINPNEWVHVAISSNTSNLWSIYINGNLANTGTQAANPPYSWYAFNVGADEAGTTVFDGVIDDVRVWETEKTQAEIQQDMYNCLVGNEPDLVAFYSFQSGGDDLTVNAHHLVPTNYGLNSPWGLGVEHCAMQCEAMDMSAVITIEIGPYNETANATICNGDSYTFGTQTLTAAGPYTELFQSVAGCDSTVDFTLIVTAVDAGVSVAGITITADVVGATYQWVDCDNGNADVNGETSQSFTPTVNGNYAVEVTENGCTETSACEAVTTIGIDELSNGTSINLYPNPNNGSFTLELVGNGAEEITVEIESLMGQSVYSMISETGKKLEINLKNVSSGVYIVTVQSAFGQLRKQVVVK